MSDKELEFFEECKSGNVNKLKQLIDHGVDLNKVQCDNNKDGTKMSALCVGALEGQLEVVKFLLSRSADVDHRCKNGETALFFAAQRGYAKIVQCLLEAGAQLVYTAKSGENTVYKNWEVFSQPLRNAYPNSIDCAENAAYKAVAQILVDHNADSNRPSVLFEALFCELTVFANPIAVYCVGVYASLSGNQVTPLFYEENFLNAVCRAFQMSRVSDFVTTIQCLLEASKPRQKEVAQRLVKVFNWADLLRRLAEDQSKSAGGEKDQQQILRVSKGLMKTLQLLLSNFNIRSDLLEQFRPLNAEDMARIGRLIKNLLDIESSSDEPNKQKTGAEEKTPVWQVLFFLLKHQLRTGQEQCVSKLLLRNPQPTDYEKKVLLRSLEDDLALAHMMLDFGVSFSGECLSQSMQNGLLDLVNRFKSNRELLFSKEIEDIIRLPPMVKNSSNRNIRRCLKIIKSQRVAMEEERRKFESELLDDISNEPKSRKRRRQKAKGKKLKHSLSSASGDEQCDVAAAIGSHDEELGEQDNPPVNEELPTNGYVVDGFGDHSDESSTPKMESAKGRKKRNKKKAQGKKKIPQKEDKVDQESEVPEDKTADILKKTTQQNRWSEVAVLTARRRRQSSSSSDCSVGAKKSVHFSHPLVFYENANKKDPNQKLKHNGNVKPAASNLKQPITEETNSLLTEAYRTKLPSCESPIFESDFVTCDGFNAIDATMTWDPVSPRWAPRFEDLSEMDVETLRQLVWIDGQAVEQKAFLCDNQKHLHIGTGPDYSNIYLGLTNHGEEVAIKKVSSKRAPLLSQKGIVNHLLDLPSQVGLNRYVSIVKDKGHCYVVQPVGEFSLDEVFRRKVASLQIPMALGCHQLAEALYFLHQNDVLHMAIKPNNVILCSNNELRFTDYGIHCRQTSTNQKQLLGPTSASTCWMAREVLPNDQEPQFSPASDVASLGMLMYYIVTNGLHPFGDPDTLPAVCITNISRGMYNLKALTDPFAHHLIKHMIVKEPEKRFTMSQVVAHPFLWSEEKMDKYLMLLSDKALSNATMDDGSSLMEKLQTVEQEVLKTYAHNKLVNISDINMSSCRGLLALMHKCTHDEKLFIQCTKEEDRVTMATPMQYFRMCFPGLLLSTYQLFTVEALEKAVIPDEPRSLCISSMDGVSKDDKEIFEEVDFHETTSDGKSEESFEILTDEFNRNQSNDDHENMEDVEKASIPSQTVHDEDHLDPSAADKQTDMDDLQMVGKKNPSLCLSPRNDKESEIGDLLPTDLLSPEASETIIINEGEWVHHSSSSDQDSDNVDWDARRAPQLKMPSSGDATRGAESPDDWIEIGSPLSDDSSDPTKVGSNIVSSDSSPSSGCSVDECFDFGSYSKPNGNVEFVNHVPKVVASNAVNAAGHGITSAWTDIDELD